MALIYAREGADVAIVYLPEEQPDAEATRRAVEATGRRCLLLPGDLTDPQFCDKVIERTVRQFGRLDVLVSNAAHQNRKPSLEDLEDSEMEETFETNIYAYIRLARAALRHMKPGAAIIATSSETGLIGSAQLPDYSATKGAINAFTKTLAQNLIERGIRVNAVAPGPVWTPLNPADQGMSPEKVAKFGTQSPMKRPAQPEELAPPTSSSPPTRTRPTSPASSSKSWAGIQRPVSGHALRHGRRPSPRRLQAPRLAQRAKCGRPAHSSTADMRKTSSCQARERCVRLRRPNRYRDRALSFLLQLQRVWRTAARSCAARRGTRQVLVGAGITRKESRLRRAGTGQSGAAVSDNRALFEERWNEHFGN